MKHVEADGFAMLFIVFTSNVKVFHEKTKDF